MALGHKRTVGEVTTESHACSELESSGTMQLLDRLGHSLAELPGLGSDTDDSSNKARASDHLPSVGGKSGPKLRRPKSTQIEERWNFHVYPRPSSICGINDELKRKSSLKKLGCDFTRPAATYRQRDQ